MTAQFEMLRTNRVARSVRGSLSISIVVLGCHHLSTTDAPTLRSLTPNRADVGQGQVVDVIVSGHGFDSLNTVSFGELVLRQVPRLSATTLRFSVPLDDVQRPDRGEAPPMRLPGGTYKVRVSTARGASNALAFTLLNGQGIR